MSTTVAKQFSDFASKRDFRLGERPSWQRSGSQGATKVYAKMREKSSLANAPLIRNRRLAQSIAYDPNYALNVKMNREISDRHFMDAMTAHTTSATEKLKGLRSHITPVFTNTHGALSSFQAPGLVGSLQKGGGWDGSGVKAVANNAASTIQSGFRGKRATTRAKGVRTRASGDVSKDGLVFHDRFQSIQQAKAFVVRKNRLRALQQRINTHNKKFSKAIGHAESSETGTHHTAPTPTLRSNGFSTPSSSSSSSSSSSTIHHQSPSIHSRPPEYVQAAERIRNRRRKPVDEEKDDRR